MNSIIFIQSIGILVKWSTINVGYNRSNKWRNIAKPENHIFPVESIVRIALQNLTASCSDYLDFWNNFFCRLSFLFRINQRLKYNDSHIKVPLYFWYHKLLLFAVKILSAQLSLNLAPYCNIEKVLFLKSRTLQIYLIACFISVPRFIIYIFF